MSEHRSLTERQRVVLAAVVQTGSIKGSAHMVGISETGAQHRVSYAQERCGCRSVIELVWRHHHELQELVNS